MYPVAASPVSTPPGSRPESRAQNLPGSPCSRSASPPFRPLTPASERSASPLSSVDQKTRKFIAGQTMVMPKVCANLVSYLGRGGAVQFKRKLGEGTTACVAELQFGVGRLLSLSL